MKLKPTATRISQWNSRTEVIYECPECKCSFCIYGIDEKFCHNSGQEIDWNVLVKVDSRWSNEYHKGTYEEQKRVIKRINFLNEDCKFQYPTEMAEREEKK